MVAPAAAFSWLVPYLFVFTHFRAESRYTFLREALDQKRQSMMTPETRSTVFGVPVPRHRDFERLPFVFVQEFSVHFREISANAGIDWSRPNLVILWRTRGRFGQSPRHATFQRKQSRPVKISVQCF
jgi:hypothetical protein